MSNKSTVYAKQVGIYYRLNIYTLYKCDITVSKFKIKKNPYSNIMFTPNLWTNADE